MEKRRFSRIGFNMAAELIVNGKRYSFSRVDNLSVGGCLFETEEDFKKGDACQFLLPLIPGNTDVIIEVFGEIARCDKATVSVRFTRIDPDSLRHLQNIIQYNAPDPEKIEDEISKHPGLI